MSMFVKKNPWQILKEEQQQINGAWWTYWLHHLKFQCVKLKSEVVHDNLNGGAHAMEKTKICEIAKQGKNCANTKCEHYVWKNKDEKLQQNLDECIKARNDLLVNYFWFFRKCRELKEYQSANKLVKQKSRERLHYVCTRVYDLDAEDSDAESVQQNDADMQRVAEEHEAALAQRKAARAKFLGRKK